jgi:hypothetical protein
VITAIVRFSVHSWVCIRQWDKLQKRKYRYFVESFGLPLNVTVKTRNPSLQILTRKTLESLNTVFLARTRITALSGKNWFIPHWLVGGGAGFCRYREVAHFYC